MNVTVDEVKKAVRKEFRGADVGGIVEQNHRIRGEIVWPGFKKMDDEERNKLVTEKIRDKFGMRGIHIDVLYPLAPGEKL